MSKQRNTWKSEVQIMRAYSKYSNDQIKEYTSKKHKYQWRKVKYIKIIIKTCVSESDIQEKIVCVIESEQ